MGTVAQQNLQQTITNITQALANLSISPKPSYSVDGVSYSWESLFSMLTDKLKVLRQEVQAEDGAFEIITWGDPR